MKKILMSLCCLLLVFMPMLVKADEKKERINVYIFYGDGCPHCHIAFEFFDSIEEEYGKYYKLVKFETWYSSSNNKMMREVAEKLGTDTENLGVPYIIIGEDTFLGYSEAYDEDIKKAIVKAYEDENYEDKIKPIIKERNKETKETIYMASGSVSALLLITIINLISRKVFAK